MRKIFTLFAASLVAMGMSAATSFTFTTADMEQSKDGYTVTLAKGTNNNAPSNANNDKLMRMYPGNTITITGANITSMQIKFALGNSKKAYASASANVGTYTLGGESTAIDDYKIDTWAGDAETVVITIEGKGQRSIHELVINGEAGDTPIEPEDTEIKGMVMADAYYSEVDFSEEGDGSLVVPFYDFDLYVNVTDAGYVYPEVYLQVLADSKTAINGTYDILYAGYWKSVKDSVETNINAEDAVGTLTVVNTDDEGNYRFTGSFTATNNKTYTFDVEVEVLAYDYDDDYAPIVLKENSTALPELKATKQPARKAMKAGQLTITHEGVHYNAAGAVVE